MLSSKTRTLSQLFIVTLCLLGLWMGFRLQFWLGLIVFLIAVGCFTVMFHRDLRPTEEESRIGWKRLQAYGKLRYLGHQILRGMPALLFLLAVDLSESYQSGTRWNPRWFAMLSALMIGGTVLLSLGWWYWQERRYGKGV